MKSSRLECLPEMVVVVVRVAGDEVQARWLAEVKNS
jgi:hypothetical protein